MKVRVSKTVKRAFGRGWKKEVAMLVQSALVAWEMSDGRESEFAAVAQLSIDIRLTKRGATVVANPDFLPVLEDHEIRLP